MVALHERIEAPLHGHDAAVGERIGRGLELATMGEEDSATKWLRSTRKSKQSSQLQQYCHAESTCRANAMQKTGEEEKNTLVKYVHTLFGSFTFVLPFSPTTIAALPCSMVDSRR